MNATPADPYRLDPRLKPNLVYDAALLISALAILTVAGLSGRDVIVKLFGWFSS